MTTKNLLVELLVEELPPKELNKLGDSFASGLFESLKKGNLTESDSEMTVFASPRRLAAHVTHVRSNSLKVKKRIKLMPEKIGYNSDGSLSDALYKRLAKEGVHDQAVQNGIVKLESVVENEIPYIYLESETGGESLEIMLHGSMPGVIFNLATTKYMRYQTSDGWNTTHFVRPIHGLVALHGDSIVPIKLPQRELEAGRKTLGHRFEASVNPVVLKNADSYETQMENEGAVIPSFEKRRAEIAKQLAAAAAKENLKPITDEALLDEVTGLVERPNVLVGKFDPAFLEVPPECLILTMKANQKYFPLLDSHGKLSNKFLIVSNIHPADASLVISGNERVVRPRLADAKFFFDQDRKKTLASRLDGLNKVVYHNKLGTQGERVQRVREMAVRIAEKLGTTALMLQADLAAKLAKADLLTDMVGEFPELQGIMGRYYAQHDGVSDDIAFAIEDHYKPRFAGDELPRNLPGICVALADKLTTLVDLFSIGQAPTGDKDPFALRRHALGVIRMLAERDLQLDLNWLFDRERIADKKSLVALTDFIYDRLAGSLREQGYSTQEVEAVVSLRPQRLGDIPKQLAAVRAFATLPEAAALAAANKRVGNILKKVEGSISNEIDVALLQEPAEQVLHQALTKITPKADAAFASGDYTASLSALAALRTPVDAFFDNVMVNAEDMTLRANRLALLSQLHQAMNRIADISKLAS